MTVTLQVQAWCIFHASIIYCSKTCSLILPMQTLKTTNFINLAAINSNTTLHVLCNETSTQEAALSN